MNKPLPPPCSEPWGPKQELKPQPDPLGVYPTAEEMSKYLPGASRAQADAILDLEQKVTVSAKGLSRGSLEGLGNCEREALEKILNFKESRTIINPI